MSSKHSALPWAEAAWRCLTVGKGGQAPSPALQGYVGREMGRVEALLKVVGSRPENLVDNFATLMPLGTAADFQRILDIKVGVHAHAVRAAAQGCRHKLDACTTL